MMIPRRMQPVSIATLLVVTASLFFAGCLGSVPGENVDQSGSVLRVGAIKGFYNDKENAIIQVDVIQDVCEEGSEEGSEPEYEFFSDHFAQADLYNMPLPGSNYQSASTIFIHSYSAEYEPIGLDLPELSPYLDVPIKDTLAVPACLAGQACSPTKTAPLKFMDMAKKGEYLDGICGAKPSLSECPVTIPESNNGCYWIRLGDECVRVTDSYNLKQATYLVTYTFYGRNTFGEEVSCTGSHHFTVDNYDYCK